MSTAIQDLNRSTDHLRHAFADSRGIYHTDFRAMLLIHGAHQRGGAMTAGELAAALELSSGAVTYLVERLAQSDYVKREVDPMDRRKVLLVPTAAARRVVRSFLEPVDEVVGRAADGLDGEQLRIALDLMEQVGLRMRTLTDDIRVSDGKQPSHRQF